MDFFVIGDLKMNYNGEINRTQSSNKISFNWKALIYWLCSLVVSLIPLYISIVRYYGEYQTIDTAFWKNAFVNEDILWVFATVLLFALADSVSKKRTKEKQWTQIFIPIGFVVFLLTEVTWILFNNIIIKDGLWPIYLGIILIVLTMILATPLKLEFINEDK